LVTVTVGVVPSPIVIVSGLIVGGAQIALGSPGTGSAGASSVMVHTAPAGTPATCCGAPSAVTVQRPLAATAPATVHDQSPPYDLAGSTPPVGSSTALAMAKPPVLRCTVFATVIRATVPSPIVTVDGVITGTAQPYDGSSGAGGVGGDSSTEQTDPTGRFSATRVGAPDADVLQAPPGIASPQAIMTTDGDVLTTPKDRLREQAELARGRRTNQVMTLRAEAAGVNLLGVFRKFVDDKARLAA
jgi:hypothetical protein